MNRRMIDRLLCVAALSVSSLVLTTPSVAGATSGEVVWTSGGKTYHLTVASLRVTQQSRPTAVGAGAATTEADVIPIVDCQIVDAVKKTRVVWFGYRSKLAAATWMPVGGDNHITQVRVVSGRVQTTTVAEMGQVNHFQGGEHHMAFAIEHPLTTVITWDVTTPPAPTNGDPDPGGFTESVTPLLPPNCPAGTPKRSAVARVVAEPGYTLTSVNEVKDSGLLIAGGVRYDATGIESRCSTGGTPQLPSVLWGWSDNTTARIDGVASNLAPVDPVVRIDKLFAETDSNGTTTTIDFARSFNPIRTVVNPQRPPVSTPKAGTGMTETNVLGDAFGVCTFAGATVTSTLATYVPAFGDLRFSATVTDLPGQYTRRARTIGQLFPCDPPQPQKPICFENGEVPFNMVRPNSVRTR